MSVKELQAGLEILVKVKAGAPRDQRWREALGLVAARVAQTFKVTEREVAILLVTGDGKSLKYVDNAFVQTKHLSFYEHMRLAGAKSGAIQKMVAAPIRQAGPAFGVIEVSRKGEDAAAAGPIFTAQDLAALTEIGAAVAPSLRQLKVKLV